MLARFFLLRHTVISSTATTDVVVIPMLFRHLEKIDIDDHILSKSSRRQQSSVEHCRRRHSLVEALSSPLVEGRRYTVDVDHSLVEARSTSTNIGRCRQLFYQRLWTLTTFRPNLVDVDSVSIKTSRRQQCFDQLLSTSTASIDRPRCP